MATRIRLRRVGRKKLPVYRIVVAEGEKARDGRFIAILGAPTIRGPKRRSKVILDDVDAAKAWVAKVPPVGHRGSHPEEAGIRRVTEDTPAGWWWGACGNRTVSKGECTVFPLTNDPDLVFAKGRSVWLVDLNGRGREGAAGRGPEPGLSQEWLVAFEGYPDRSAIEGYSGICSSRPRRTPCGTRR
ncbi:MAG: 30S ribosomal protein S16 [Gemmatimonadales bacterium]